MDFPVDEFCISIEMEPRLRWYLGAIHLQLTDLIGSIRERVEHRIIHNSAICYSDHTPSCFVFIGLYGT